MGTMQWIYSEQLTPPIGQDEMMDGEKNCVQNPSIEEARPDI